MRVKTFETFMQKKSNLSKSSLWLLNYGNKLINEYLDLEKTIQEVKGLEEAEDELEELLQEWINHLVKNPPKDKPLSPSVIRQYANAVVDYLKYHRFRVEVKNLTFPKNLQEEKYAVSIDEIKQVLKVASYDKLAYYLCLISTGARPREILALTEDDIEWVGDKYKALIPARLTKKGISRTVFFSKECNPYISQLLKKDRKDLFKHQPNLKSAMSNEAIVFGNYCDKVGLDKKYESTGVRKITLYSFRSYFFTKVLDLLKDDIAHALIGHGAYLNQYQRRNDQQKKELWDELESEVLVFDDSKKDKKIKDLEIAVEHNKKLQDQVDEQQKQFEQFQKEALSEIAKLQHLNKIQEVHLESNTKPNKVLKDGKVYEEFYSLEEIEKMKKKLEK